MSNTSTFRRFLAAEAAMLALAMPNLPAPKAPFVHKNHATAIEVVASRDGSRLVKPVHAHA